VTVYSDYYRLAALKACGVKCRHSKCELAREANRALRELEGLRNEVVDLFKRLL